MKLNNLLFWLKKRFLVVIILVLLITTLPLHIKIMERNLLFSEDGKVHILYMDGQLRIPIEEDQYVSTDLDRIHKWHFNVFEDKSPKIRAVFVKPFIFFESENGRILDRMDSLFLYKLDIICAFDRINFSTSN